MTCKERNTTRVLYIHVYTMNDEEFLRYLDEYLKPPADVNLEMAEINIIWERDSPDFGARHIRENHSITEEEIEQVIFEMPPFVETKRHPDYTNRTEVDPKIRTGG